MGSRSALDGALAAAVLVSLLATPHAAVAQAWVTPRGEGAVTMSHQFVRSSDHINRVGARDANLGSETLHVAVGEVVYGVTDRLSTEVSLVWLATKWEGRVEDRHGPLDTGVFHGSFQDIRVAARYQLVEGPVNIAPFAAFGGPTTDYETRGHSSFGRHMEEFTLGTSLGGRVGGRVYWQALGSYAFVNDIDTEDFNLDHLNGDLELGVQAGSRLTARVYGSGQWMWNGLQVGPITDHLHLRTNHDRFTQSSFLNVGGGLSLSLSPRVDLGLTTLTTVSARNFHALEALVTNLTWKFGGGFRITPPIPDTPRTR